MLGAPLIASLAGGALGSMAGSALLGSTALGGALTGPIASAINTGFLGSLLGPVTTQGVGGALGGMLGGAAAGGLTGGGPGALMGAGMGALGPTMMGGQGMPSWMQALGGAGQVMSSLMPAQGPGMPSPPLPPLPQPRPIALAGMGTTIPQPQRITVPGLQRNPQAMSMLQRLGMGAGGIA